METFVEAVTKWPVIVQGALGSALFWVFFQVVQKSSESLFKFSSSKNRNIKISYLITKFIKYNSLRGKSYSDDSVFMTILLFRAFSKLIMGLIWLMMGLLLGSIFETFKLIFGIIGYVGCIFYLFSVLQIIKPIRPRPTPDEAETEIQKLKDESKKYKELEGFIELE